MILVIISKVSNGGGLVDENEKTSHKQQTENRLERRMGRLWRMEG